MSIKSVLERSIDGGLPFGVVGTVEGESRLAWVDLGKEFGGGFYELSENVVGYGV